MGGSCAILETPQYDQKKYPFSQLTAKSVLYLRLVVALNNNVWILRYSPVRPIISYFWNKDCKPWTVKQYHLEWNKTTQLK